MQSITATDASSPRARPLEAGLPDARASAGLSRMIQAAAIIAMDIIIVDSGLLLLVGLDHLLLGTISITGGQLVQFICILTLTAVALAAFGDLAVTGRAAAADRPAQGQQRGLRRILSGNGLMTFLGAWCIAVAIAAWIVTAGLSEPVGGSAWALVLLLLAGVPIAFGRTLMRRLIVHLPRPVLDTAFVVLDRAGPHPAQVRDFMAARGIRVVGHAFTGTGTGIGTVAPGAGSPIPPTQSAQAAQVTQVAQVTQAGQAGEHSLQKAADTARAAFADKAFDALYFVQSERCSTAPLERAASLVPADATLLVASADMRSAFAARLNRAPMSLTGRVLKRALDIVVAGGMLVVLSPLLLLVACAVIADSGLPVLFRQRRIGFCGAMFPILKFRTMTVCEDGTTVTQAQRHDKRVTAVGRILRRSSLDELPQLVNVLLGHMSLVGPRPHAVAHDVHYGALIDDYEQRQSVKPGLTGWAQVNGFRGETRDVAAMEARVAHDVWYARNWSILLDIKILVRTAIMVLADKRAY